MRKGLIVFLSLIFFSGAVFCDESDGEEVPVLHVYTWEGYFAPALITRFENENNCRIELSYYDSNETMIEKVQEGDGYDIITPPAFAINKFSREGIIRKLDHSLLPNLVNLLPETSGLVLHGDVEYSIPYTVTLTVVGYNKDMVPEDALGSWNIFADSRFSGKMAMINDMRETLGAALKHLGYSLNTTDPHEIKAAERLLQSWKKNVANFSIDQARYGLRDGKYAVIQAYHGDVVQMSVMNPKIQYFVPLEGSAFNSDQFVICSETQEPELAHSFINFFLDGEVAAINMDVVKFSMPNSVAIGLMGSKISEHQALILDPELLRKCEVICNIGPEDILTYEDAWLNVLISK